MFGDNIDKATEILVKLHKNENDILGVPDFETIDNFFKYCIEKNYFTELLVSIIKIKITIWTKKPFNNLSLIKFKFYVFMDLNDYHLSDYIRVVLFDYYKTFKILNTKIRL